MNIIDIIQNNYNLLLSGTWITVQIVLISLILGFFVAVLFALLRLSKYKVISGFAYCYMFFFRGTPLLVQFFIIYYITPQIDFIRHGLLWDFFSQAYWCSILTLTLNTGAYTAEIFRGAISSVPKGQIEAGQAAGMSKCMLHLRVIFPQAIRISLPAYGNEMILLLKGSSLASIITLMELTGVAKSINSRTFLSYEIFLVAGIIYFMLSYVITRGFKWMENKLNPQLG